MIGDATMFGRARRRVGIWVFVMAAGASVITGCASPREHLYTIESIPSDAAQVVAADSAGRTVVVGPVSIPQLVDRPQLVIRTGPSQVDIAEQERWAAPLKESLPRLLASELNKRAPGVRFVEFGSAAINLPSAHLRVEIRRFDVEPGRGATIDAHWIYRPNVGDAVTEHEASFHEPLTGTGYEGYVEALRRACLGLARSMAASL